MVEIVSVFMEELTNEINDKIVNNFPIMESKQGIKYWKSIEVPYYTSTEKVWIIKGNGKKWYENGQLMYICTYKNGQQDGQYKIWYKDGKPQCECAYKEGNQQQA